MKNATRHISRKSSPQTLLQRGRPSSEQSAAITRLALESATQLFLQYGYEQMTMDAVAAHAGITKATLYNRFGDKRSLMEEVLAAQVARWSRAALRHHFSPGADLTERLTKYAKTMIIWGSKPEVNKFRHLAAILSNDEKRQLRKESFGYAEMVEIISNDIREYGSTIGLNAKEPEKIAEALMSLVAGWTEERYPPKVVSAKRASEEAEFIVRLLINGKDAW